MSDREKVIKGLSICNSLTDICYNHGCPYYNGVQDICGEIEDVGYSYGDCKEKLHNDTLALLKEQNGMMIALEQSNAVNGYLNAEVERLNGLLKEQEPKTGKWERHYSRPGVYADLFWWCSVCGEPTRYNDAGIFYQYCPHCGAKLEPCEET